MTRTTYLAARSNRCPAIRGICSTAQRRHLVLSCARELSAAKSHFREVSEDRSAVNELLRDEPSGGEHGETAVLELLGAQIAEIARHSGEGIASRRGELEGVEVEVTRDVVCIFVYYTYYVFHRIFMSYHIQKSHFAQFYGTLAKLKDQ
jgi:hypothetical protein